MKIISFAHLTVSRDFANNGLSLPEPYLLEYQLTNSPEKYAFMLYEAKLHNLSLYKIGRLTVEIVEYEPTNSATRSIEFVSEEPSFDFERGILRSSSFTKDFFETFTTLFRGCRSLGGLALQIPSLVPGASIEIQFQSLAPSLRKYLDENGMVALAFWVDSLSGFEEFIRINGSKIGSRTKVFKQQVGSHTMDIAFVNILGVNIELISRPS